MYCVKCGATNPDNGRFCTVCGARLQPQTGAPGANVPPVTVSSLPESGRTETSGKAIASLICGILFFIFPAAVAAIILGHLSLSEIGKSAGRLAGRGMAIIGLVLGYAGVLFIPFILILLGIAIPNLLRAQIAANEASAIGSLRTIVSAARMYNSEYSNGYPPSLAVMDGLETGSPSCSRAQLIDSALASGQKHGYVFRYTPILNPQTEDAPLSDEAKANGCTITGARSFTITADPVRPGTTGRRSFFVDETGVMREEQDGHATADSRVLGGSETF